MLLRPMPQSLFAPASVCVRKFPRTYYIGALSRESVPGVCASGVQIPVIYIHPTPPNPTQSNPIQPQCAHFRFGLPASQPAASTASLSFGPPPIHLSTYPPS